MLMFARSYLMAAALETYGMEKSRNKTSQMWFSNQPMALQN